MTHFTKNEKLIHKNLDVIFQSLNKEKIKFWLDGGALLRFARKKKIYDASDFDVGTEIVNLRKIVGACKQLEKKGFKISLQNKFPFFCDSIKIYFPESFKLKQNLDIYLYYRKKNELIRPSIHKPRFWSILTKILFKLLNNHSLKKKINLFLFNFYLKNSYFLMHIIPSKHFKYKINYVNYNGLIFGVPNYLNQYLEYRYGSKWKRYHKDWNASDGNFLRIRKINMKIKFFYSKDFNFRKFKTKPNKKNFKFRFTRMQEKKIIFLDEK